MNFDRSKWSSREWIASILAVIISMLIYTYGYVFTLKMEPSGILTFLALAATFLLLDLLLRKLIAPKESVDQKK